MAKLKEHKEYKFPEGFLWGSSTSSHQVEGFTFNDWAEWEKSEKRFHHLKNQKLLDRHGKENYLSGRGTGHYHLFKEDFKLAKELGHNAFRFSIEWSRVEPQEGKFDEKEIAHYKERIKELRRLGIEPFITLWHFTTSAWLSKKGGWENKKTPEYFARYVKKVVKELSPDVVFWITLNEPEVYSSVSYLAGVWPPQKTNPLAAFRVVRREIKAHKLAYQAIKKINPKAQIGIAKHNIYFEAHNGLWINRVVKKIADYVWNFYFLNRIRNHQDFIGLNQYFHTRIHLFRQKNQNKIVSDMGWELYPEAIRFTLHDLKKYGKPIYITENGLADATDKQRPWYIYEVLKNVHTAILEGADVRGYLHWSFLDNFEWDSGFWPRFGLIEVDYRTLKRTPRLSSYFYKDIAENNGLDEEIINRHKHLGLK